MKSTATPKSCTLTPKELNIKQLLGGLYIPPSTRGQNCGMIFYVSVDFIYGYSYLIPSEFWVNSFSLRLKLHLSHLPLSLDSVKYYFC